MNSTLSSEILLCRNFQSARASSGSVRPRCRLAPSYSYPAFPGHGPLQCIVNDITQSSLPLTSTRIITVIIIDTQLHTLYDTPVRNGYFSFYPLYQCEDGRRSKLTKRLSRRVRGRRSSWHMPVVIWPQIVGVRAVMRHGIILVHVRMRNAHRQYTTKKTISDENRVRSKGSGRMLRRFGGHFCIWARIHQDSKRTKFLKLTKPRRVRPPYHT